MRLAEYCRGESGFLLLPIERLSPQGSDADLAAFLQEQCGWSAERVRLLDEGFSLYWKRSRELAARTRAWPSPRIRNIGIADDLTTLRPFAQVLNTSTWSLYDCDFDPSQSNPEFLAYLLALGDWMAVTGEVTQAPVLSAAWWLLANDESAKAFKQAAKKSQRPGGDALRAVAQSLNWLGNLRHQDLRPATSDEIVREIPAAALQVPVRHEAKPPRLIEACRRAAVDSVESHRSAWRGAIKAPLERLLGWLSESGPRVVVTSEGGATVWVDTNRNDTAAIERALSDADPVAVESIHADLELIDEHSRQFLGSLAEPDALSSSPDQLSESGYAYMHPDRPVIAYNLSEPGMERCIGPPLPYERAMLGARVWHEWSHLADEAEVVHTCVDEERFAALRETLAGELAAAINDCDQAVASVATPDLHLICTGGEPGAALAELLLSRAPDYRANLLARSFMSEPERETYARHNIRSLRNEYPPAKLWRALIRYAYEYQYLLPGLSLAGIEAPYDYFALSTGFGTDFIDSGAITRSRFDSVSDALAALLAAYQVDTSAITLPTK